MIPKSVKTILFDLGGVIITLYPDRTTQALLKLKSKDQAVQEADLFANSCFTEYETGKVKCENFLRQLKQLLETQASDEELRDAWNSMLGNFTQANIEVIRQLRQQGYQLLLFSNTNVIHLEEVLKRLRAETDITDLTEVFDKVYYSQELGMRKPDKKSFEYILNENKLRPQEVLFIDDNADNIESASTLGMQTILWTRNNPLATLLS